MITQETIQNILETARVEEVIGDFVNLKRRGINMIGLCPFHNEKTPSFTVSPAKGIFKCFGCGKSGSAVNFIMEHEQYSYPEALKYLANKYGIEVEEEKKSPEQEQAQDERESLYSVNAAAKDFFTDKLLNSETGKAIGLSYFKERGFNDESIQKFQLGYSPDAWDAFTVHALENGFQKEFLVKTGLTIDKESKLYDRFRSRVIFPIHNLTGRVLGFGGRILSKDPKKPKYVNSPESDIYNKSKILYGIYFAKKAIITEQNCLLVEGYTDVISLHQAGIENVVASSGTSLTTEQIRLIKRYAKHITILFDGDEAGLKASFRGINMILAEGLHVKVVLFPEGADPDSFAREKRPAEVKEFIQKNAKDFITFKTGLLLKETENDPIKKAELIKEIVATIAEIPDVVDRTVYINECSQIMDIAEKTLVSELNKILRAKLEKEHKLKKGELPEVVHEHSLAEQIEQVEIGSETHEREIIRLLLNYSKSEIVFKAINEDNHEVDVPVLLGTFIVDKIKEDELGFDNINYQKIFACFADATESEKEFPDDQFFINHTDESIKQTAINIYATPYSLSDNWERKHIFVTTEDMILRDSAVNAVNSFKLRKVELLMTEIEKQLKNPPSDDGELNDLLSRYNQLSVFKKEFSAHLKRIILK